MNGYGRTGYLPQMQGRGVFNPYMKHPDIAGGINMLTEIIARRQAQERAQQQQTWERSIAEEQIELQRRREERLGEERPTQWDFKQNYASYMANTKQWTPQEAAGYLATNKTPEKPITVPSNVQTEIMKFHKIKDWGTLPPSRQNELFQDYLIRKRPSKIAAPQVPATVKGFLSTVEDGIKRYQSRIDDLEKPPTSAEVAMGMFTGGGANLMQQKTVARESLMAAQSELIRIQSQMSETNKMPSAEDIELAKTLLQFTGRAEKEKEFWKTGKPRLTDRNTVIFEGKEYPLNPDGTVTINGKVFEIKTK